MTQDEIIRMAREAGFNVHPRKNTISSKECLCDETLNELLERFAVLVASHEREKQAEQEPVIGAYEVVNEKGDEWSLVYPAAVHRYKSIPEERITQTFYAAPVRTKDLTDDDVAKAYMECTGGDVIARCRAVIAADREKNK